MKVTLTCEKCGQELREPSIIPPNAGGTYGYIACPNCAKLTYGPLTEEMVAEALDAAWLARDPSNLDDKPGYEGVMRRQARFVLRLLNESRGMSELSPSPRDAVTYDWLLDLARQK